MYELGIRHAYGLPHVVMAWEGQRLPFDVQNQRTIMLPRDLRGARKTREQLTKFIKAAKTGAFYKPMEAVARHAVLEKAEAKGEDGVLQALVAEVRQMRGEIGASGKFRAPARTIGEYHRFRENYSWMRQRFLEIGGSHADWTELCKLPLDMSFRAAVRSWESYEWRHFAEACFHNVAEMIAKKTSPRAVADVVNTQLKEDDPSRPD